MNVVYVIVISQMMGLWIIVVCVIIILIMIALILHVGQMSILILIM